MVHATSGGGLSCTRQSHFSIQRTHCEAFLWTAKGARKNDRDEFSSTGETKGRVVKDGCGVLIKRGLF